MLKKENAYLIFLSSSNQLADIFTKQLPKENFFFIRTELGILNKSCMDWYAYVPFIIHRFPFISMKFYNLCVMFVSLLFSYEKRGQVYSHGSRVYFLFM